MSQLAPSPFLSRILALDAATCTMAGLALVFGASHTAELLGLPVAFQRGAGVALLAFAGFVAWVAAQSLPSRAAIRAIIVVNALWVVDSALILLLGIVDPTALGIGLVVVQAVAVAILAGLQGLGLRRIEAA